MGLETVTNIADFNKLWPLGTDPKSNGDDHIRNIKTALLNDFAGFTGAVVVTGTDGGSANVYTITPTNALPAYASRMLVVFSPAATNTGACTLNISGLGAADLISIAGTALVAGDLVVGSIYIAVYDGADFRLLALTKNYVDQLAMQADLPLQSGNAGKFLATDGVNSNWTDTFGVAANEIKGANIASAATINLTTATGNLVHITGTTTITAITIPSGAERTLVFDDILTLTHNATTLILPTGANITTAAGDVAKVRGDGSGNARVVSYQRADGTALSVVNPGMLKLAGPSTPSASNTLDFLSTFSDNAANFNSFRIIIDGVLPSANDDLLMRFANAGAVDTGSKYYDTTVGGATDSTAGTSMNIQGGNFISSGTGKGVSLIIDVLNAADATNLKVMHCMRVSFSAGGAMQVAHIGGGYDSANAASGFRLYWSTGSTNFSAVGKVTVFGYNRA